MLLIQRSFFFFSKSESSDHSIIIIPSELISMPGNELSWVNWRSSFTWKNVLHLLCHFFFTFSHIFTFFPLFLCNKSHLQPPFACFPHKSDAIYHLDKVPQLSDPSFFISISFFVFHFSFVNNFLKWRNYLLPR